MLVALSPEKIELLRSRLDGAADAVTFADMHDLGRNPALIIPAWEDFIARNATGGRRVRGLGEPIWPERSHPEMVECGHHESLLNLAFADGPEAWFLCAYDTHTLRPGVLRAAAESHPLIDDHGTQRESSLYVEPEEAGAPFDGPRPTRPPRPMSFRSTPPTIFGTARRFVADRAAGEVIDPERAEGSLAVDELVTNSLRHGGGSGVLRAWHEDEDVVCEVADAGTISDPPGRPASPVSRQAGRARPLDRGTISATSSRSARRGPARGFAAGSGRSWPSPSSRMVRWTVLGGEVAVPCHPQSALAGLNARLRVRPSGSVRRGRR